MRSQHIESLEIGAVALLGVPWDENSSYRRGAAQAPPEIRRSLLCASSNLCAENGVDLAAMDRFVDVGDLHFDSGADSGADSRADSDAGAEATAATVAAIEAAIASILDRAATPIVLGGDHAITYPVLSALGPRYEDLTILHIDAHPDLYDSFDGNRLSHASPFARIMEAGLAKRLVQVGIRTMNPHQREQAERFGVEVFEMKDWSPDRHLDLDGDVYVSIDLDGIDPAFAPGVSHPEPGGLSTRDVLQLLQSIEGRLIGADIVEYNPALDHGDTTARVAAKFVKELAARML